VHYFLFVGGRIILNFVVLDVLVYFVFFMYNLQRCKSVKGSRWVWSFKSGPKSCFGGGVLTTVKQNSILISKFILIPLRYLWHIFPMLWIQLFLKFCQKNKGTKQLYPILVFNPCWTYHKLYIKSLHISPANY
jgi:hypothetical protein